MIIKPNSITWKRYCHNKARKSRFIKLSKQIDASANTRFQTKNINSKLPDREKNAETLAEIDFRS